MQKEEVWGVFYGKEKTETYKNFLEIENSIENSDELYKYFDEIKNMLLDEKSYIRIRGFRIICKLAKWDKLNKIESSINLLLNQFDDDKPTAVRQCLATINQLLLYKPNLANIIKSKLMEINYLKYRESMSPLIKKDIESILEYL